MNVHSPYFSPFGNTNVAVREVVEVPAINSYVILAQGKGGIIAFPPSHAPPPHDTFSSTHPA